MATYFLQGHFASPPPPAGLPGGGTNLSGAFFIMLCSQSHANSSKRKKGYWLLFLLMLCSSSLSPPPLQLEVNYSLDYGVITWGWPTNPGVLLPAVLPPLPKLTAGTFPPIVGMGKVLDQCFDGTLEKYVQLQLQAAITEQKPVCFMLRLRNLFSHTSLCFP